MDGIKEVVNRKISYKYKDLASFKAESILVNELIEFTEDYGCGSVLCCVQHYWDGEPDYDLKPDIALHWASVRRPTARIPDLVAEFVSRRDHQAIISEKISYYLRSGVGSVWIFNIEEGTLEIKKYAQPTRVLNGRHTLEDDALPGFSLDLSRLFTP